MNDAGDRATGSPGDSASAAAPRPVTDRRVLDILVCPMTRDTLIYDRARGELVSRIARLAYPIRDGVPIMIPQEARTLEEDERPGFGPPSQMRKG